MLERDVPSNGARRRSCGGKLLREMQERDGHIKNALEVFDEMLAIGEGESLQDAVGWMLRRCAGQRCAGAARQGRGERGSSR
jgi:hypothetical protein